MSEGTSGTSYKFFVEVTGDWFDRHVQSLVAEMGPEQDGSIGVALDEVYRRKTPTYQSLPEDTMPLVVCGDMVLVRQRNFGSVDPKKCFLGAMTAGAIARAALANAKLRFEIPQLLVSLPVESSFSSPEAVAAISSVREMMAALDSASEASCSVTLLIPKVCHQRFPGETRPESVSFELRAARTDNGDAIIVDFPDEVYENELSGGYAGVFLATLFSIAAPGASVTIELSSEIAMLTIPRR